MTIAILLAAALAFADLDTVDRAVADFAGAGTGMPGGATGPVDRRLRLSPCAAPLALSWRTPARESVVVQCPDAGGWKLYVPMRTGPQAGMAAGVPAINRGDAVAITVNGEGFSVSRPGEALESGAAGAWIKVRPITDTRLAEPLRAHVLRPGVVELPLP